jgi:hypothetical protein
MDHFSRRAECYCTPEKGLIACSSLDKDSYGGSNGSSEWLFADYPTAFLVLSFTKHAFKRMT